MDHSVSLHVLGGGKILLAIHIGENLEIFQYSTTFKFEQLKVVVYPLFPVDLDFGVQIFKEKQCFLTTFENLKLQFSME